jgi:DNA-binding NarL/FixJ family response regulator
MGQEMQMTADGSAAVDDRPQAQDRAFQVLLVGFDRLLARVLHARLTDGTALRVAQVGRRLDDLERVLRETRPRTALLCWEAMTATELRRLTTEHRHTGFVVLAESLTREQGDALVRCGAAAALERGVARSPLVATTILAGFGIQMQARTAPAPGAFSDDERLAELSLREAEVLGLLECGESARTIAPLLELSRATVNVHIRAIYRKLGVHTRAELLASRQDSDGPQTRPIPEPDGLLRLDARRRESRRAHLHWLRRPV